MRVQGHEGGFHFIQPLSSLPPGSLPPEIQQNVACRTQSTYVSYCTSSLRGLLDHRTKVCFLSGRRNNSVTVKRCMRVLSVRCESMLHRLSLSSAFLGSVWAGILKEKLISILNGMRADQTFCRQCPDGVRRDPACLACRVHGVDRSDSSDRKPFESSRRLLGVTASRRLEAPLVENSRHVCVVVVVQEVVHFGYHSRILLVAFTVAQRPRQHQRFRHAATEANTRLDLLAFSNGDVFDEQMNHSFASSKSHHSRLTWHLSSSPGSGPASLTAAGAPGVATTWLTGRRAKNKCPSWRGGVWPVCAFNGAVFRVLRSEGETLDPWKRRLGARFS